MRHVVGRLLDRCGFTLSATAQDYLTLRALVSKHQPTVAVVTLPLPGMNGLRAVRELREAAPDCQIVLLSAFDQLDVAAVEAGAAALVAEDDLQSLQVLLRGIADTSLRQVDLTVPWPHAQTVPTDGASTSA